MFLGDVDGELVGRDVVAAEPAEGLAGRQMDLLHVYNQHAGPALARQGRPSSCRDFAAFSRP
jgi:hypothetical protein